MSGQPDRLVVSQIPAENDASNGDENWDKSLPTLQPNAETVAAMIAARSGYGMTRFNSVAEFIAAVKEDDEG